MQIRRREVRLHAASAIWQLTVPQIAIDDADVHRFVKEVLGQAVEPRREAGDGRAQDNTSWTQDSAGFDECRRLARRAGSGCTGAQAARLPRHNYRATRERVRHQWQACQGSCRACRSLLRLLEVERHGIDQVRVVAALCQPEGVVARPAADINDHGGRRRQKALEEFLGRTRSSAPSALRRRRSSSRPRA